MDVQHVAKLANLPIKPDQEAKFAKAFAESLQTVDKIKSLDTKDFATSANVSNLVNVTRPDVIDEKRILKIGDYFKVPAIFDQE